MEFLKRLLSWGKKEEPPQPSSIYAEEFECLAALQRDGSIYSDVAYVETGIPNIEAYCQQLEVLNAALHDNIEFPRVELIAHRVKRCHFWRNMKGEFIDVVYFQNRFKRLAEKALKQHESLGEGPHGRELSRTLVRATPLLFDLRRVIRQL